jgi:Flp pilus assembly protein TadG
MTKHLPRPSRRGANALEFALTLPIFLVLVFGLIDYGWLFSIQAGLDNAVSLACREGAMMDPRVGSPSAIASADLAARSAMFCNGACTLNVQDLRTGAYVPPNRTLLCSASLGFNPLIGLAPMPGTIDSVSYYRLEWQRN